MITRRDMQNALDMSMDYFNSLMETVHSLKSSANAAHLVKSIEQHKVGNTQQREMIAGWNISLDRCGVVGLFILQGQDKKIPKRINLLIADTKNRRLKALVSRKR